MGGREAREGGRHGDEETGREEGKSNIFRETGGRMHATAKQMR